MTGFAGSNGFKKGLIINIVLFLGLMALYAVHFLGKTSDAAGADVVTQAVGEPVSSPAYTIAYVDNQVILEEYLFAISMRSELEAEQSRLESDLNRRQRNFQAEVERFQRDIQAGNISREQAQLKEQELMQKQQDLFQLNETYQESFAQMEFELNTALFEKVSDFLRRYNEEKGYEFILGYSMGGSILYADKTYDITADVIERLNREVEDSN